MKKNKNLWVLVFISVINSLGFGILVPLIYPFSKQYGISEQTLGLLTASFSVAQFFATPFLGALSDKYGRKPVLILSLIGTCVSFILFAQQKARLCYLLPAYSMVLLAVIYPWRRQWYPILQALKTKQRILAS